MSREAEEILNEKPFYIRGLDKFYGYQTTIRAMQDYAEAYHAEKSEWISVEDRLPEQIGSYIVFYNDEYCDGNKSMAWMFFNSNKEWCLDNSKYEDVTHWKLLPPPPNE